MLAFAANTNTTLSTTLRLARYGRRIRRRRSPGAGQGEGARKPHGRGVARDGGGLGRGFGLGSHEAPFYFLLIEGGVIFFVLFCIEGIPCIHSSTAMF